MKATLAVILAILFVSVNLKPTPQPPAPVKNITSPSTFNGSCVQCANFGY